jgi:hypothetical protein
LIGSSLSWALYFAWHEAFKRWLCRGRKKAWTHPARAARALRPHRERTAMIFSRIGYGARYKTNKRHMPCALPLPAIQYWARAESGLLGQRAAGERGGGDARRNPRRSTARGAVAAANAPAGYGDAREHPRDHAMRVTIRMTMRCAWPCEARDHPRLGPRGGRASRHPTAARPAQGCADTRPGRACFSRRWECRRSPAAPRL